MCISYSAAISFLFEKSYVLQFNRSSIPLENWKYLDKFSLLRNVYWKNVALNIKFCFLYNVRNLWLFTCCSYGEISVSHLLVHWNTPKVLLQTWHIWLLEKGNTKPYFPCQNFRCTALHWIYMLLPNAKI